MSAVDTTILAEMSAARTPGDWEAHDGRIFVRVADLDEETLDALAEREPEWEERVDDGLLVIANFGYEPQAITDAQYTAKSLESIPVLLERVAVLQQDVMEYRAIAGRLADAVEEIMKSTDPRTSRKLADAVESWENEMREAGTAVANAKKNQKLTNPLIPVAKPAGAQHDFDKGPLG